MHAPLPPESREPKDDDLHVINGLTICCDGLTSHFPPRRRVPDQEIEVARSFLAQCRRASLSHGWPYLVSSYLKHVTEKWAAGQPDLDCHYVATGAVIIAALELGIAVAEAGKGSRDAAIGINVRDVKRLTRDTWYWSGCTL
jgi:hypothetical protein